MARTNVRKNQLRFPMDSLNRNALYEKLKEHDSALDTAEADIAVLQSSAGVVIAKKTVTVGHADLTDAVAGEAQVINIGTALPANARILGVEMTAITVFSGGSVASLAVDIGGTDPDALVDGADLFTGSGTTPRHGTPGVNPNGNLGGQQLTATFIPDVGHALDALTAGSVTITVTYMVLP